MITVCVVCLYLSDLIADADSQFDTNYGLTSGYIPSEGGRLFCRSGLGRQSFHHNRKRRAGGDGFPGTTVVSVGVFVAAPQVANPKHGLGEISSPSCDFCFGGVKIWGLVLSLLEAPPFRRAASIILCKYYCAGQRTKPNCLNQQPLPDGF